MNASCKGESEDEISSKRIAEIQKFWKYVGSPEFSYLASPSTNQANSERGQDFLTAIPRASQTDAEQIRESIQNTSPLIIEGVVEEWPCFKKWTWDFFQHTLGETEVSVDVEGTRQTQTLSEYIASFSHNSLQSSQLIEKTNPASESLPPYLRLWHYELTHPELEEDFQILPAFQDWFSKLPEQLRPQPAPHWIFIGPAGTYTPLHLDPWATHAWFAQLAGRKRFTLFPPEETIKICNGSDFVNMRNPDQTRFPELEECHPLTFDLLPGELLFLPCGWAHTVTSLDRSISLTHNFLDQQQFQNVRMAFMMYKMQKAFKKNSSSGMPLTSLSHNVTSQGHQLPEGYEQDDEVSKVTENPGVSFQKQTVHKNSEINEENET